MSARQAVPRRGRRYAVLLVVAVAAALLVPLSVAAPASAHGWVTSPPSRQDHCANRTTSFDCGQLAYEPQSVEAAKGATTCSGGGGFGILDDNSLPWPVTDVGSQVTFRWRLTAAHRTSSWDYFVDGELFRTIDQGDTQPPSDISHTLTGLPAGRHTVLARWNIADTAMAFYSCVDLHVSGSDGPSDPDPTDPTDPSDPTDPACDAAAWDPSAIYVGGDRASHEGHLWRAKWWTHNEEPGTTGEWGVWEDLGPCGPAEPDPEPDPDPGPDPDPAGDKVIGYFAQWGVYGRNYHVKNIDTSGSAARLTHILYAFGNVQNGRCTVGDSYADYEKAYTAEQSVDGVADTWDQELRGSFNQLRELKAKHPHLKVLWSFGGWTWSGGFGQAAQDPAAFARSCRALVEDPRWADVFDGIDIDWEYPNACGLTCDTSGPEAFPRLMGALRAEFGNDLVTAAITADGTSGGKIEAGGYGTAAQYVDWYMPMTYDFFGAWAAQGPTAPHSPLRSYPGIPTQGFDSATAIAKLRSLGIPSSKLLLGIGFYGRGWTGVTQSAPGGSATGAAPGTYEAGIEDYEVLKARCPATGTVGGTAYAHCGDQWWSYDTPATIGTKMDWAQQQGLAGAFFWELSGDTPGGELVRAVSGGLAD